MNISTNHFQAETRVQYTLCQTAVNDDSGRSRSTYGIVALRAAKEIDRIADITPNCTELEKLVYLCNTQQLSSLHLHDVVEDFLATLYE